MNAKEYFKDENPAYVAIFEELARRVGKTLEEIELNNYRGRHEWPYAAYRWTEEEEADFRDWFVQYVYKHRQKVLLRPVVNKGEIRNEIVPMFMLEYGWRHKPGHVDGELDNTES